MARSSCLSCMISWSSVVLDGGGQEEEGGGGLVRAWPTGVWWIGGGVGIDRSWFRLLAATRIEILI